MSQRSLLSTALFILMAACPAVLPAQEEISSKEEERLENLARDNSEWSAPKGSLSVGFKVLSSGVNVQFGKLGYVPFSTDVKPASFGEVQRVYNNGSVDLDAPRLAETDGLGHQTSTQGGRYKTTSTSTAPNPDGTGDVTTTTETGDFLSYTPGLTRSWSYITPQQAYTDLNTGEKYISMSSYSTISDGETRQKKQGPVPGVEVQLSHVMGRLTRRTEWSLVMGLALNGINNKTAGDVHSTLVTVTDLYSLHGQDAPTTSLDTPYSAPSGMSEPKETTVPISAVPDITRPAELVTGAATVHGRWQVRGAYFMIRVGPSLHTQLTERFGLSASLGLAGAYAGTNYSADETLDIPNMPGTSINKSESSDTTKFLAGYYADINLDFAANERLGLFGGVSAQKFGDYDQTLDTRTARVDLGTSVGLRGGVTIKF